MKNTIKTLSANFGYTIHRTPKGPPNPIEPWDSDETFLALYSKIAPHTVVDQKRCFFLYQAIQDVSSLEGDIAEVGVFKGGTARLFAQQLSLYAKNKKLHLFDTFEGMPKTDKIRDLHQEGDFKDTSLSEVKDLLASFDMAYLYPGFFPKTAEALKGTQFALAHIDVDIYQSVLDSCVFFYPRMVPGGFIIFDDYGFISCPGAKEAVDAFFADKPEHPLYLPTGQCLVVKQ